MTANRNKAKSQEIPTLKASLSNLQIPFMPAKGLTSLNNSCHRINQQLLVIVAIN
jgi:hypothetical protein